MADRSAKKSWPRLLTRTDLTGIFRHLGVSTGMSVIIHSALSGLGYLVNGPYDIIDALQDIVGAEGTLLMPAHSGQLTDPADWVNPLVPEEWVETIRQNMNPFDPLRTPTRNRGILSDCFLRYPGVKRSIHPINSVAALGAKAEYYTSEHPLHESEGVGSPSYRLYQDGGHIMLMGTGLEASTELHLAEFMADCPYLYESNLRVLVERHDGANEFVRLAKYPGSSIAFETLRPELTAQGRLNETWLGDYRITLVPVVAAVDLLHEKLRHDRLYLRRAHETA